MTITQQESLFKKISAASLKFLSPMGEQETYKTIGREALLLSEGAEALIHVKKQGELLQNVYRSSNSVRPVDIRKKGYAYKALKTGQSFLVHKDRFGSIHPELIKQNIQSTLFIPLSYQSKRTGVLVIRFYEHKEFSQEAIEMLNLFGSLASMSIRKMQLSEDMKKALQTRDLFISMASHELKTPLTTISVYVQLILEKTLRGEKIDEKWAKSLSQETARLKQLVNELLQINQIEKGHLKYLFEKQNLQKILMRAVNNFRVSHPNRMINVHVDAKEEKYNIFADYDKLLQVVLNLLTNAAKFSEVADEISVSLAKNHAHYLLSVEDKGSGIPPRDLKRIFNKFYKSNSHQKDGMGLGLFLTKTIVEEHGGEIMIQSKLKKGTKVVVSLPA